MPEHRYLKSYPIRLSTGIKRPQKEKAKYALPDRPGAVDAVASGHTELKNYGRERPSKELLKDLQVSLDRESQFAKPR